MSHRPWHFFKTSNPRQMFFVLSCTPYMTHMIWGIDLICSEFKNELVLKSKVSIWEQAARRFIFPLNWRPRATIGKLWVTVKSSSVKVWQNTCERVIFLIAEIVEKSFSAENPIERYHFLFGRKGVSTFPASWVLENMSAFSYQCLSPFFNATNWSTVAQIDVGPSLEPFKEDLWTIDAFLTAWDRHRTTKWNQDGPQIHSWDGLFHQHTNI